jgi:hypothetical protein
MGKRVVKINEAQLNDIIQKVIQEQEAQVMNTGPSAEQIAGTPDNDTEDIASEEPNFADFIGCAKELMNQGVTIGNLVDKLLEADDEEEAPEEDPLASPEVEGGVAPETPVA